MGVTIPYSPFYVLHLRERRIALVLRGATYLQYTLERFGYSLENVDTLAAEGVFLWPTPTWEYADRKALELTSV